MGFPLIFAWCVASTFCAANDDDRLTGAYRGQFVDEAGRPAKNLSPWLEEVNKSIVMYLFSKYKMMTTVNGRDKQGKLHQATFTGTWSRTGRKLSVTTLRSNAGALKPRTATYLLDENWLGFSDGQGTTSVLRFWLVSRK